MYTTISSDYSDTLDNLERTILPRRQRKGGQEVAQEIVDGDDNFTQIRGHSYVILFCFFISGFRTGGDGDGFSGNSASGLLLHCGWARGRRRVFPHPGRRARAEWFAGVSSRWAAVSRLK